MKTKKFYSRKNDLSPNPYPINLGLSTLKYAQGFGAYLLISDNATHLFFKNVNNSYNLLVERVLQTGMDIHTWEITWNCFKDYTNETEHPDMQSFLIFLTSTWDWFIDKLGIFIYDCECQKAESQSRSYKDFGTLHKKPIMAQISLLEETLAPQISNEDKSNIKELFLIRDLGIHRGWKVDDKYILKSDNPQFKDGDLIQVSIDICLPLYRSWINIINVLTSRCSKVYANCPDCFD